MANQWTMVEDRHSGESADLECHRQDSGSLGSYAFDRNIRARERS